MYQNKSAKIYSEKNITVCNAVYFRLCIDLMHILPPVNAEGFDVSHHPKFAECIKMASILNIQSCDLKHGGTFSKYCEIIILSIESLARLKDQVKSLGRKIFINKNYFHRLLGGTMKVVFSFFYRSLSR